jgi:CRP-like cAMP-binding protein
MQSAPATERTSEPELDRSAPLNRILAVLPAGEWASVAPRLERVALHRGDVLFGVDRPIEYVYFPETAVGSLVSILTDGSAVETATIGNEGMVGMPILFGAGQMSAQCFTQVPGDAMRMSAADFESAAAQNPTLRRQLLLYAQVVFTQATQASACNRKHSIEERCARWLLMTHDRVLGDQFDLTQLFLSQMLGVRRATVTVAMGILQRAGLIDYRRGRISVLDRERLEAASCACYAIIRAEFNRLLGDGRSDSPLDHVRVEKDGKSTAHDGAPEAGESTLGADPG